MGALTVPTPGNWPTNPDPVFPLPFDQVNPLLWMAHNPDVDQSVLRLQGVLYSNRSRLQWYEAYLEGEQPVAYMSKAMQSEVGNIIRSVVLNWCRLIVKAYGSRLKVDGFRYAGDEGVDKDLWRVWQASGLDRLSKQGFNETLALGRSYFIVGAGDNPGDDPIVTVESPFQVTVVRDPRTRRIIEGCKFWNALDMQPMAQLYQPDRTVTLRAEGLHWVATNVDSHMMGRPPIVEIVNNGRILRPAGLSEFHDVIPIVDAAIKMATDMMTSAEYHAMPRRWVTGVKKEDFTDQNGNKVSPWSRVAGRVWSMMSTEAKVGQFQEAQLSNFHDSIKLLAQLASQIAALPDYLAFNSVNPASADAMRAIDAQLELRITGEKHIDLGESLEDVMRLVLRFKTGEWDPRANSLETVWANPGILTVAQQADATTKLVLAQDGQGRSVVPIEQAREDLGYGPIARARMAQMDAASMVAHQLAVTEALAQHVPPVEPPAPVAGP